MASTLLRVAVDIAAAVGDGAASEFSAFCDVYAMLPELDAILDGNGVALSWPDEPSARYALTLGLALQAEKAPRALAGFAWLVERATPEWVQLYAADVAWRLRARGELGVLAVLSRDEPAFRAFLAEYGELTGHGAPHD